MEPRKKIAALNLSFLKNNTFKHQLFGNPNCPFHVKMGEGYRVCARLKFDIQVI